MEKAIEVKHNGMWTPETLRMEKEHPLNEVCEECKKCMAYCTCMVEIDKLQIPQ